MSLIGFWSKMMNDHMSRLGVINQKDFDRMVKDCEAPSKASPELKKRLSDARRLIRE